MKQLFSKFYNLICTAICMLCLLFTGLLWTSGFVCTAYSTDMDSQVVRFRIDNIATNLFGLICFATVFFLIGRLIWQNPGRYKKILLGAVLLLHLLLGIVLILFGRTSPTADAWSVYAIAESFSLGDFSAIHPTDSYLSYYPQQIGLVFFFEPIFKLWHLLPTSLASYHFIKCIYVGLVMGIIFVQYKLMHLLFENDKADCVYLLLAGTNLPLVFYSSFVYSEIPSFAALTIGLYCLTFLIKKKETLKKNRWISFAGTLLFLPLSVLLRKNSLILIIAVLCVILTQWIKEYNSKMLPCLLLLCLVCSMCILPLVQKFYEFKGHNKLKSGVTATSYFAMGMQEASRGMGWYNGFNFYTYQDTGMDTKATNEIAKQAIHDRLDTFRQNPAYAASFYGQKYLSQWTDGTYACRQATLANFGGRREFINEIYQGKYSSLLINFCNHYQNWLYLGALMYCLFAWKKRKEEKLEIIDYLCFIGVFGGFLFHMLWEANSRYIFLYGLLLLPYAARGLTDLVFYSAKENDSAQ